MRTHTHTQINIVIMTWLRGFLARNCSGCPWRQDVEGFNHGLPCYVQNMSRGTQVDENRGRRSRFVSWLGPEGHDFNIAWQAMIKSYYSMFPLWRHNGGKQATSLNCVVILNVFFRKYGWANLFSHVIIGIAITVGRDFRAPDNKSRGCFCRNSRPNVINPLN